MTNHAIKILAVVLMCFRHVGRYLFAFSGSTIYGGLGHLGLLMMAAGAVSYPLFAFLAAEGVYHTKNVGRYMAGIGMLAIFSEIPYNFYCQPLYPYVPIVSRGDCYSLFLIGCVLLTAWIIWSFRKTSPMLCVCSVLGTVGFLLLSFFLAIGFDGKLISWGNYIYLNYANFRNPLITIFLGVVAIFLIRKMKHRASRVLILALFALLADLIQSEYGAIGVLMVYVFYFFREKKGKMFIGFLLLLLVYTFGVQDVGIARALKVLWGNGLLSAWPMTALLAYVPMYFYNTERGKYLNKYLYYLIYPLHLFGIYILVCLIMKLFA